MVKELRKDLFYCILQFLAKIIAYGTYLILCGLHEYFKTVGFF